MTTNKTTKKILLAEDDKFISRAYSDGLSRAGFEVILAMDGIEAVELARKEKPDMILLDLIMPRKNGFEVLIELNDEAELKKIPVIIATIRAMKKLIVFLITVTFTPKYSFSSGKVIIPTIIKVVVNADKTI